LLTLAPDVVDDPRSRIRGCVGEAVDNEKPVLANWNTSDTRGVGNDVARRDVQDQTVRERV